MNNQKSKRPIDLLASKFYNKFGKTYVYLRKKQVSTLKGALILAFIAGIIIAIVWSIKTNNYNSSSASIAGPSLLFSPSTINAKAGETFTVFVTLDTAASNIVATRAIIDFNKTNFELVSWDTTNSVFSANNTCLYNGKACEIVDDNRANGSFSITLAKPSPGVNTSSGKIVAMTFKALNAISQSASDIFTSEIKLRFVAASNATDSDIILDDGKGTDVIAGVSPLILSVVAATSTNTCTSFSYSAWGACQSDGTQTRTIISSLPLGCTGGAPILSQSCTPPLVVCTSFTYSNWGICQADGTQVRTVTTSSPSGCTGGTPILTQSCTPTTNTCTSFSYSKWSACVNGIRTRRVITASPIGCTGGSPSLTQSCNSNGGQKPRK